MLETAKKLHAKISALHLERAAYVYVRQSTNKQVRDNHGSRGNRYALLERATDLGWHEERVRLVDDDQGISAKDAGGREGFKELVGEVSLGHAGIVLAYEASRLARNNADWYALLDVAALRGTLIADSDGVCDPADHNDRLLLGLRGMMSEAEVHLFKLRLEAGRLRRVEQGTYRQALPTGLVRLDNGRSVKDPDVHVRRTIELVFGRFEELGSAQKVMRSLKEDGVLLPRRQVAGLNAGELLWKLPSVDAIYGILHNPAYAGAFAHGRTGSNPDKRPGLSDRVRLPIVARILELAAEGHRDTEIARRLTKEGFRSARLPYVTRTLVEKIRTKHGQPSLAASQYSREKIDGYWSVPGLSRRLGTSETWVRAKIAEGTIPARRHPTTERWLIEDDPALLARIEKLAAARRRRQEDDLRRRYSLATVKLQLVTFFEDLRSERRLMRVVADRLSLRWYVGYDLHEPLPDHSSLARIRDRLGLSVFRRFFERIVQVCFEAGLVRGEEPFFDATKVEADASLDSTRPRSLVGDRLEKHLTGVFPEDAPPANGEHSGVIAGFVGPEGDERRVLAQTNARQHRWIAGAGRQERAVARWGYTRMADLRVSTTDPDASPMHQKNKNPGKLGYLTHYVVDGGKARVVLNVLVTGAEVTENLPMQEMLFGSTFRWGLRPRSVTGDAAYGTRENVAAIERAGIRAYAALPDQQKRTSLFTIEDFLYDAEKDLYTCPRGETLRRRGYDHRGGYVRYAASASACNACPLKSGCTKGPKGRWLSRGLEEKYLERVRAYRRTEAYRKALRKRAVWVEPLFGEAKEWHGSRRFGLRGLEKVNAEALMIASGQNVKRLVTFGSRGPKKTAMVAALRPPEEPSPNPICRHRTIPARRFSTRWPLPRTPVNKCA